MRKKILIIEDDAVVCYGLQAKLSSEGYIVESNNGSNEVGDVIKQAIKFNPDYIILDLILPKVDGFELLKAVKAGDETSKIPIFIFTNLSDNDSRERCDKLGAEYYFIKEDFNIDEFVDKLGKITNMIFLK